MSAPAMEVATAAAAIELAGELPVRGGRGWVHLLPAGRFHGRDGRGPYIVADSAAIVEASRRAAGKRQMVVDYDHSTDLGFKEGAVPGQPAPAAGWIVALQAREDGVWGLVEWTPRAAELLKNREYRYLSPAFHHDRRGRISVLLRASLTNIPNLDQLTALASAEEGTMEKTMRGKILDMLELDSNADDATVLTAIGLLLETKATHAQGVDPSKFVPIGDFERAVSEVRRLDQGVSLQAAETFVDDQIGRTRLLPWMKEWAVSLAMVNKPALESFISKTGPSLQSMLKPIVPAVPPSRLGGEAVGNTELEVCQRMGISVEDYRKAAGNAGA